MEQAETIQDKRIGRLFLKMTAMLSMLCDHIAFVLVSQDDFPQIYYIMRIIGRIAFPIFCFMLVEGFMYTHSRKNYVIRLAAFALISEIPFDLVISGDFFNPGYQNVMWTLLIGFIVLCAVEKYGINYIKNITIILCMGFLAYLISTDYSAFGVFLIAALYFTRFNNTARIIIMSLLFLTQGSIEIFAVFSIPFIIKYNPGKNDVWLPKYFFYVFYPAHLLALYIIHILI